MFLFLLPLQGFESSGRDKPGFRPEFLPLTYLAKILSDIEKQGRERGWKSVCVCVCMWFNTEAWGGFRQNVWAISVWLGERKKVYKMSSLSLSFLLVPALNPFEEQENVDARFVEETALKQTLILLGYEEKWRMLEQRGEAGQQQQRWMDGWIEGETDEGENMFQSTVIIDWRGHEDK